MDFILVIPLLFVIGWILGSLWTGRKRDRSDKTYAVHWPYHDRSCTRSDRREDPEGR